MAVDVVTGPAFSGKRRFVQQEIARREREGELGLVALDYTALYDAIVPGEQSIYRDEAIADSGAARLAGYTLAAATNAAIERELSGYVTTNSPRQAIELVLRTRGTMFELAINMDSLAAHLEAHEADIARRVPRARLAAPALRRRCRGAVVTYFNEASALAGRSVTPVRQAGRSYRPGRPQQGSSYDKQRYSRGAGNRQERALAALREQGNTDPTPADVLREVLAQRGAA